MVGGRASLVWQRQLPDNLVGFIFVLRQRCQFGFDFREQRLGDEFRIRPNFTEHFTNSMVHASDAKDRPTPKRIARHTAQLVRQISPACDERKVEHLDPGNQIAVVAVNRCRVSGRWAIAIKERRRFVGRKTKQCRTERSTTANSPPLLIPERPHRRPTQYPRSRGNSSRAFEVSCGQHHCSIDDWGKTHEIPSRHARNWLPYMIVLSSDTAKLRGSR